LEPKNTTDVIFEGHDDYRERLQREIDENCSPLIGMGVEDSSAHLALETENDRLAALPMSPSNLPNFDTDSEGQFLQELLLPGNEARRHKFFRDYYNNHPEFRECLAKARNSENLLNRPRRVRLW